MRGSFPTIVAAAVAIAGQACPAADDPASPGSRYLEAPLKGEVGKEITAPGVRDAIRAAKQRHCDAVVFVIDTPGGRVMDAEAIAAIMDQERAGLRYYAVVTRAISAAVWPLSRMDRVFFAPGSAAGAAVAFTYSADTGQFEVDAKFNAAMAARVSGAAELHGQPGAVYRAMMIKDARLYRWRGKDGKPVLASEKPADVADAQEIDSEQTVLAWSAEQAAASGFGALMPSADAASLGALLGAKAWERGGEPAAQTMARWKSEIERAARAHETAKNKIESSRKAVIEAAKHVVSQVKAARAADPARVVKLYYREGSGVLTSDSQVKWRDQSDRAIREWNNAAAVLSDLTKAERRASNAVEDYNAAVVREWAARLYAEKPDPLELEPVNHGLDIPALKKEAADAIQKLAAERVRSKL